MARVPRRRRLIVALALLGALAVAGAYRLLPGSGGRSAPEADPEASFSCSSCDARHARLRDRAGARKLQWESE